MAKLFLHLLLVPHGEQSMRNRFLGLSAELTQNRGLTQSHLGYYTQEDFQISKHDEFNLYAFSLPNNNEHFNNCCRKSEIKFEV
jgi:hypothetical protein